MKQDASTMLQKVFQYVAWGSVILIILFKILTSAFQPIPQGDENFYLSELARFHTNGVWNTFSRGVSHLFMSIWYLVSFLPLNSLIIMRLLNLVLGLLDLYLIYLILKPLNLKKLSMSVALCTATYAIFISQSGAMHYRAISDPLMTTLALTAIYFVTKYVREYKLKDLILAALFSGMMFWVRNFAIIIFGGILASVAFIPLFKRERALPHLGKLLLFFVIFIIVLLVVQIPSIHQHQKISFERKIGSGLGGWGHRNWLTQKQQLPSGSVFAYRRVEWDFVDEYIESHGKQSIPRGVLGVFIDNPKLKTDITIVNLFFRIPYILLMSTGLLLLGFLRIVRCPESWLRTLSPQILALLAVFFSVACGVSLAIINYIEHRWVFTASISALIIGIYGFEEMSERWQKILLIGQLLLIPLLSLFSAAKLLP
ncbi:MAG: hypothetical protein GX122_03025 [Candidatus Cloacimonetes bacterium]|nr:hypothetical protein [Candidatus Cloacimonadota bacterium]